ncbi:hypothetical protein [Filifactor villosus]|uniref:Chemotaxis protein n=1 Tax=Filifactor villosus TaxID=29374 RepID=A0ABV9QHZ9_9FIRM
MSFENWISRIRCKQKEKSEIRMREKFSFLLDEIRESENRIIEYSAVKAEERILPSTLDFLQKTNTTIIGMASAMQENNDYFQGMMEDLKQTYFNNQEITMQTLRSIVSKIEHIESDLSNTKDYTETAVQNSTKNIVLSIDEVKSLLQLLAVNNLLDEIDIKKRISK